MPIFLSQLWEELLTWERTRWHWSKHVKFRPSWLFHKSCLSLHSCQTAILPHWGSPLRPFPRVPLCPVNIPKITIVHVIACSLNLHMSYTYSVLLFFGSMGRGLLSMGKQSIRKTCRCPATRCYKRAGNPPAPLNKHNRFQYTVPSHIKSCTAHSGGKKATRSFAGHRI